MRIVHLTIEDSEPIPRDQALPPFSPRSMVPPLGNDKAMGPESDPVDAAAAATDPAAASSLSSSKTIAAFDATTTSSLLVSSQQQQRSNHNNNIFPFKLYKMLQETADDPILSTTVVSWVNHGTAFQVYSSIDFVGTIMPLYFDQTKYESFRRQLNLYGIKKSSLGGM